MASLAEQTFSQEEKDTIKNEVSYLIKPDDIVFLQNWKDDVDNYLSFFEMLRTKYPDMALHEMIQRFYNFTKDVLAFIRKFTLILEEDISDCNNASEIKLGNAVNFNTRCENINTLYAMAKNVVQRIGSSNNYWTEEAVNDERSSFTPYEETFLDEYPDYDPDAETEEETGTIPVRFLLWLTLIPEDNIETLMSNELQVATPEPMPNTQGAAEEQEQDADKPTCFDFVGIEDVDIQKYLAKDRNNFVIKLPNVDKYECWSMDYLKSQWNVGPPARHDLEQPYYKEWYECQEKNNIPSTDNVDDRNVSYVKLSSSNFLVRKPYWIYEGYPPEPRLFELIKTNEKVKTLASNDMMDGTEFNYVSGDHCNTDSLDIYKLVKLGVEENDKLYDDFWNAVNEGNVDQVNKMIKLGLDINKPDDDGTTPLLVATIYDHLNVVEALLNEGVNMETVDDEMKKTALYWAAEKGHLDILVALIEKGANVNHADDFKSTPLLMAAEEGHVDVVRALIDSGANIDNADNYDTTPLISAAQFGNTEVVRVLVDAGANIEHTNKDGKTALDVAQYMGDYDVVEILTNQSGGSKKRKTRKSKPKQKQKRTKSKRSTGKKHKMRKVTRKKGMKKRDGKKSKTYKRNR